MDEFIKLVTEQLGINATEGRSATGGVLNFIREQVGDALFHQISQQLPGAQSLASSAQATSDETGGGLLGSITSVAGSLLGGKVGSLATIASILSKSGIGLENSSKFISMLMNFLRDKLGDDTFSALAAKLPELAADKS
ncbi:MAG: DUF2780 domain-containing protein [Planctomycetaceae bacterium]|nr:DUF2780 domain-containing protein [Planctomycetaceae bacterium]